MRFWGKMDKRLDKSSEEIKQAKDRIELLEKKSQKLAILFEKEGWTIWLCWNSDRRSLGLFWIILPKIIGKLTIS